MQSTNGAHSRTIAREQVNDVSHSGVNVVLPARQKLSATLPPLVFGTATFNYQFNTDPFALNPTTIVHRALELGVRAFDTSPYYGPAEEILSAALTSPQVLNDATLDLKRDQYFILTKAGRLHADEFDYSADWIRYSVLRSCARLHTSYLDVVYLHDVEFVSPAEVLEGILALRRLRDEGLVRYVGICGYPVGVLCELSEQILRETGEAIDIVQSYAHFTVQNQKLVEGMKRLVDAGVDVVTNASPLGMGLVRSQGVPVGGMGKWHPAPEGLKEQIAKAADWVASKDEKLETIAIRFAMEEWKRIGGAAGVAGQLPQQAILKKSHSGNERVGISVMGVSKTSELEDTMAVYETFVRQDDGGTRQTQVREMVEHIRSGYLGGQWKDYSWSSPDVGFVNRRKVRGPDAAQRTECEQLAAARKSNKS